MSQECTGRDSDIIEKLTEKTRKLVQEVLLSADQAEQYEVQFLPNKERALELALARGPKHKHVIMSPFENPRLAEFGKWYSSLTGANFFNCEWKEDTIYQPWKEQECLFVKNVSEIRVKQNPEETTVLVVSEVAYRTGMVLPLSQLVSKLRSSDNGQRLQVVIEGTRSVGNGARLRFLESSDAFVFESNSWLMSPEPCGILISRSGPQRNETPAPPPELEMHTMSALWAALELIHRQQYGFEGYWNRSKILQKQFFELVRSNFEVIGEGTLEDGSPLERTLFSAIRPREGHIWNRDASDNVEVAGLCDVRLQASVPLRVSLPYFLDFWKLNRVCRLLNDSVEQYGGSTSGTVPRVLAA